MTAAPSVLGLAASLRLCKCGCGRDFAPQRSTREFFDARCRKKHFDEKRRREQAESGGLVELKRLLETLGAEERGGSSLRATGERRECHCNGSGLLAHEPDGEPYCVKCGGLRNGRTAVGISGRGERS